MWLSINLFYLMTKKLVIHTILSLLLRKLYIPIYLSDIYVHIVYTRMYIHTFIFILLEEKKKIR